ncbi:hypothetical protein IW136_001977 [Coemansia sp. RSA 678]|nr:hypothetical protein IW136_001977 [Coemansia sp. RSA 678]
MIFESKLPNIHVPNVNLAQFVLDECKSRTQAHDTVFVDSETNEAMTVDQLEMFVHGFANGLRKCGINEGDVVATVAGNSVSIDGAYNVCVIWIANIIKCRFIIRLWPTE